MSEGMTAELAVTALRNAVVDRRPVATVVHSDPGQFRSNVYVRMLAKTSCAGRWAESARARIRPIWRQRRNGIVLRARSEQRARHPPLENTRRATASNHRMDREDLPPSPTTGLARQIDPHRIRDDHDHTSQPGCVTKPNLGATSDARHARPQIQGVLNAHGPLCLRRTVSSEAAVVKHLARLDAPAATIRTVAEPR